jgi:hypothetical protein
MIRKLIQTNRHVKFFFIDISALESLRHLRQFQHFQPALPRHFRLLLDLLLKIQGLTVL